MVTHILAADQRDPFCDYSADYEICQEYAASASEPARFLCSVYMAAQTYFRGSRSDGGFL